MIKRWFWSIVCELYTSLVLFGYDLPPPKALFNQPKGQSTVQFVETLRADFTFNSEERVQILRAIKDIERFTNDLILFEIEFDLNPSDEETIYNQSVIIRAREDHPALVPWDNKSKGVRALGLCFSKDNYTKNLYIVPNRISNNILFRTTMIHEFGHFIGLGHEPKQSIMHAVNYNTVLYPTYIDAAAFAKLYNCSPEEFCYFKL